MVKIQSKQATKKGIFSSKKILHLCRLKNNLKAFFSPLLYFSIF